MDKSVFLKIAKVKDIESFYKKFPTEEAFMAKYGKQVKKLNLGGAMATMNKLAGSNAFATGVQSLGDVVGGIQQMKDEKQQMLGAQQMQGVSNIALQASMTKPEQVKRQYLRPPVNTGEEFFPIYGAGTVVAKHGAEITNTFAPNTIYTDLEEAQFGLNLPEFKTFPDFLKNPMKQGTGKEVSDIYDFAQKGGGDALTQMTAGLGSPKGYGVSGAGKVGGGIGATAGMLIGGPVGSMLGKFAGQTIGNLVDRKADDTEKFKKATDRNMELMALNQGAQSLQRQNYSYMKDGGFVNPQVATSLEGIPLTRLFAPDPYMNTLRTGGNIRQNNMVMDGKLKVDGRGDIDFMAYNPEAAKRGASGYIGTSRGPSHDNGGFNVAYGDEVFEMEGNETVLEKKNGTSIDDKSLNVLGNLKIGIFAPSIMEGVNESVAKKVLKGRDPKDLKYKHLGNDIARLTKSLNNEQNRYQRLLESSDDNDLLKMGSVKAGYTGLQMMYKDLDKLTDNMVNTQQAVNKTAEEFGIKDPESLYIPGKKLAKMGAKITTAQTGKTISQEEYDEAMKLYNSGKIKEFQQLGMKLMPEYVKSLGVPTISGKFDDGIDEKRTEALAQEMSKSVRDPLPDLSGFKIDVPDIPNSGTVGDAANTALEYFRTADTQPFQENYPVVADRNKNWLMNAFNQIRPYLIPSNAESLDPSQISGELMALADNDLRPVRVQTVQSQLASPYKVSFQDMINEITAGERAATRLAGYNPAAQSIIAAAAAREKSGIRGRELAENLRLENEIYNRNRDVLNADRMKNLELYDQQFVRQEQALANTKAVKQAALNSINAKILQNRLANRQVGIAENMYNYRFDKQGRAINVNPLMAFNTEMDIPVYDNEGNVVEYKRQTKEKYDKSGLPAGKEITTQTRQKPTTAKNGTLVKAVK